MNVIRTVEPQAEPVTIDEAKAHLHVTSSDEDTYIAGLIKVARRAVEDMTGRALIDTVFTYSIRNWCSWVNLPRGMAHTIDSVKYDDDAGAEQTVDASLYGIHPYGDGCSELAFYQDFTEPELVDRPRVDRIRIQFTAGYGDAAADVPETLKQAILFIVAHFFEQRTPVVVGAPVAKLLMAVESLCGPYKIYN